MLCENLFGLRKYSSIIFAINSIFDKFVGNVDQNLFTRCLFLDLSKAFDTVYHILSILRKIYNKFVIRGKPHDLISTYLTDRYQYAKDLNSVSPRINMACGVPQGFFLGPLCFLPYANDIPSAYNFDATLFADDTCLMTANKNLK